MVNVTVTKSVLALAGLIACAVGLASMIVPVATEAGLGISIGNDASLLNEMRASGGGLFGISIFILAGVFIRQLAYSSAMVATMVFLGYALARIISIALDGMPNAQLLLVLSVEIAVGLLCFFCFCQLHRAAKAVRS